VVVEIHADDDPKKATYFRHDYIIRDD
jgi:hypothetical protein